MTLSIPVSGGQQVDPRPALVQNSRASDDDPISKAQAVPTPSNPIPHSHGAGASGVVTLLKSK
jgi:hypothetical protein